jgi:serine protease inhibitor
MSQRYLMGQCRAAAGILVAAVLGGCGGGGSPMNSGSAPMPSAPANMNSTTPPAVAQAMDAGTAVDPAIVTADNTFGLNLFQNLNAGASGNVAIAPISVAMTLQILYNGAAGATQQAMGQTLQLGAMGTQDLNNANAALQGSLMNADPNVQIVIANSLWLHTNTTPVLPSFTQMDEMYYGATVGDLAGAPADVNNWVSSETNGLITGILPAGNYGAVVAVLANVIYFKGQWSTPFDPSQTMSAPFTLADGTQATVQMMHQSGSYSYLAGTGFQALRLPYGQGRLSMLLVLPDSGTSLSSLVGSLTLESLNSWIGQMQSGSGDIALPRFTATYGTSLPPALTTLGMGAVFCNAAPTPDFSALAPGVCVSDVEHKTIVEVDETGTVAAGATTVSISPTAVAAPQFTLTLDHPFLYAIRDDQTGELLFIGTLMNPTTG